MRWLDRRVAALAAAALVLGALLAASAGASAVGGLTATFAVTSDWGTGYEAGYTITNDTAAPVSGWTVAFDLRAGQQMGNYWNATEAVSGNRISFTNRSYNRAIVAGGGMVNFGFIVTGGSSPPVNCTINGSPCRPMARLASSARAACS